MYNTLYNIQSYKTLSTKGAPGPPGPIVLTLTPISGGTQPVSAHLTIIKYS